MTAADFSCTSHLFSFSCVLRGGREERANLHQHVCGVDVNLYFRMVYVWDVFGVSSSSGGVARWVFVAVLSLVSIDPPHAVD